MDFLIAGGRKGERRDIDYGNLDNEKKKIIYFVVEFLKNRENWTFHDETFSLTFWYQRFFAIGELFRNLIKI